MCNSFCSRMHSACVCVYWQGDQGEREERRGERKLYHAGSPGANLCFTILHRLVVTVVDNRANHVMQPSQSNGGDV